MDFGLGSLLGAGISAIGSLVGSSIGNKNAIKAVEKQNEGNMALAQYQFDKNLEMWNLQNQYNLPSNQMQRLKDANLNPNLMYGEGTTGNADSAPKYDAPQMQAYTNFGDYGASQAGMQLAGALQSYANFKKTEAETNAIRQNTQNMQTQEESLRLDIALKGLQRAKTEMERNYWLDNILLDVSQKHVDLDYKRGLTEKIGHDIALTDAQVDLTRTNIWQKEVLTPIMAKNLSSQIALHLSQVGVNREQIRLLQSKKEYQDVLNVIAFLESQKMTYENHTASQTADDKIAITKLDRALKEQEAELNNILIETGINLKTSKFSGIWSGAKLAKEIVDQF